MSKCHCNVPFFLGKSEQTLPPFQGLHKLVSSTLSSCSRDRRASVRHHARRCRNQCQWVRMEALEAWASLSTSRLRPQQTKHMPWRYSVVLAQYHQICLPCEARRACNTLSEANIDGRQRVGSIETYSALSACIGASALADCVCV